jgi:hypothetical protein
MKSVDQAVNGFADGQEPLEIKKKEVETHQVIKSMETENAVDVLWQAQT